jgi:hypothetical protein
MLVTPTVPNLAPCLFPPRLKATLWEQCKIDKEQFSRVEKIGNVRFFSFAKYALEPFYQIT